MSDRIEYSIYDLASGQIVSSMTAYGTDERDANVREGFGWVWGSFDPVLFYVKEGAVVPYPSKPADWMTFDHAIEEWQDTRTGADLEKRRGDVMSALNRSIQQQRTAFVTDLPGQDMIYLRKEDEGRQYIALATEPETLDDFPMIAAEVGITAPTAYQVAVIWVQLASMWVAAAAQLEHYRLSTGAEIAAAADFDALDLIAQTL